ncbi:hypothetical protein BC830DRAFT_1173316 [Chytriomyces sp. MP71]|nr:hypothetical protein BC830DRAFT_1173316 [Chytriomyces sp. MP71]
MFKTKPVAGTPLATAKPEGDPDSDKIVPKLPSKQLSLVLEIGNQQLPPSDIKPVDPPLSARSTKPLQTSTKDASTDSPRTSDVVRRVSKSMIPVPSLSSLTDIKAPATEVIVKRIERNPNSRRSEVFESNPNKSGGPSIQRIERRSIVQQQAGQVKVVTVNDGSRGGNAAPQPKLQQEEQPEHRNSTSTAGNRVRFDMNERSESTSKAPQGKSGTNDRPSGILRRPTDVGIVKSPIFEERGKEPKNSEKIPAQTLGIEEPADATAKTVDNSQSVEKPTAIPSAKFTPVKSTAVASTKTANPTPTKSELNLKPPPAKVKTSQTSASEVTEANDNMLLEASKNPTIGKDLPKAKDSKSLQTLSLDSLTPKPVTVSKKKLIPIDGPVLSKDGPRKVIPGAEAGKETGKPTMRNLPAKELKVPAGKDSSSPPKLPGAEGKDIPKKDESKNKPLKEKLPVAKLEMSKADSAKGNVGKDKSMPPAKEPKIPTDPSSYKKDSKERSKSVPPSPPRKDAVKDSLSTAPLKPEFKKPTAEKALKREKSTSERPAQNKTEKLINLKVDNKSKLASIDDIKSTMGPSVSKVESKRTESSKSSKEMPSAGGTGKKTDEKSKTTATRELKTSSDNLLSHELISSETIEVPQINDSRDPTASIPVDVVETRLQRSFRLRTKLKMDVTGCYAMGLNNPLELDSAPPASETDATTQKESTIPAVKKPEPPPPVIKVDDVVSKAEPSPLSLRISSPLPLQRHPSARRKVMKNLGYPVTGWAIEKLNIDEVPDKTRLYKYRRARSLEDVSRIYNWYRQAFPLPFGHNMNYNDVLQTTKKNIVQVTRRV